MTKFKHGGKRPGAGKPKVPFIRKKVQMHFDSEQEYRTFLNETTPRERVTAVLETLKEGQND